MFRISAADQLSKARKVAEQQGLSLDEALDLVQMIYGSDPANPEDDPTPSGSEASQEEGEEPSGELNTEPPTDLPLSTEQNEYDELETEAIDKDFDLQMNADTMDEGSFETAQTDLVTTLSKLRTARKVAFGPGVQAPAAPGAAGAGAPIPEDPNDPDKQRLDELMISTQQEYPDVAPQDHDYARGMLAEMRAGGGAPLDPNEEAEIYRDLLGKGQNRVNAWLAHNLGDNLGIPKKEGKVYRSNVNPRLFRTAIGKTYKLALGPDEEILPDQDFSQEPAALPASEPAAPAATPATQQAEDVGNQYALNPEEKGRLAQIAADAEANGSSVWRLLGLFAGFVGDKAMLQVAPSQTETAEMQTAFKEGQIARGGAAGGTPQTPQF